MSETNSRNEANSGFDWLLILNFRVFVLVACIVIACWRGCVNHG